MKKHEIDLNIKKNKRAKGCYFHKSLIGVKSSHTKRQAAMDITKEIIENGCGGINYIFKEYLVLNYCKNANKAIRF